MMVLPIAWRELRLKARKPATFLFRCGMALVACLMALGLMTVSLSAGRNPSEIGRDLFLALSLFGLWFGLLAGPLFTADSLSEEKRAGTLGLLFLTDLKGHDLVAGKLSVAVLPTGYALLAGFPALALAFFLGGVTLGEFWRMVLALATILWFSLTAGLMVSAVTWSGRLAQLGTWLVLSSTIVLWPSSTWLAQQFGWGGIETCSLASPAFVYAAAFDSRFPSISGWYWSSLAVLHVLSLAMLALACHLLPGHWQDRPLVARPTPAWKVRPPAPTIPPGGTKSQRQRSLLEEHPALWLTQRHAWPWLANWLAVFFLGAIIVGVRWLVKDEGVADAWLLGAAYLLHGLLKVWLAIEAGRRASEDARSGALELLLVTPLTERQIARGWLLGLKRQFFWPICTLFALDLGLMSLGQHWPLALLAAMGLLVADAYALAWTGIGMGLRSWTPVRAAARTLARIVGLPWVVFLGLMGALGLLGVEPDQFGWVIIFWFLTGYVTDVCFCLLSMVWLAAHGREAVAVAMTQRHPTS